MTGIFYRIWLQLYFHSEKEGSNEYLGDINYFLEQHELEDMRAVEMKSKKEKSAGGSTKAGKQGHADQKQKKKLTKQT